MTDTVYHPTTLELSALRRELAPEIHQAFEDFSRAVFAHGALDRRMKQLIAVAVTHVTQCPYCIKGHPRLASREGASPSKSCTRSGLRPRCVPAARTRTPP
jgi:AhpD family alkylhydroperoxidase